MRSNVSRMRNFLYLLSSTLRNSRKVGRGCTHREQAILQGFCFGRDLR